MKHIFHLMIFTIMACSCRRDDPKPGAKLPAITQEGLHTFGFILDDEVWRNQGKRCFLGVNCQENLRIEPASSNGDVFLIADKVTSLGRLQLGFESFLLRFRPSLTFPQEILPDSQPLVVNLQFGGAQNQEKTYTLPQQNPRFRLVVIRFDPDRKVIAGTFSGVLFRSLDDIKLVTSKTDSVKIMDGRFDIRLAP
jgi:hypothetical protein